MPDFDAELRACVETILGVRPPLAGDDAFVVLEAVARRAQPRPRPDRRRRRFAWPGPGRARPPRPERSRCRHVRLPVGADGRSARSTRGGGTIEEGWLLARLDLRLPIEEPYGRNASTGSVAALLVAPEAEQPPVRVDVVSAVAGRGLVGDRYHDGRGTFSGPGRGYELTLVEAEALDDGRSAWEQARRNVVTRGISLNALVGRRFSVGPVECVGRRLAEPCAHLEKLTRPGMMRPLVHRAGLRADISAAARSPSATPFRPRTRASAAARTWGCGLRAPPAGRAAPGRDSRPSRRRRTLRS